MNLSEETITSIITGIFSLISIVIASYCTYRANVAMKKHEEKDNQEKYPPLSTHPLFINIDEHIRDAKCLSMDGVSPGRVKLASDFLKYSIECWREPCIDFAQEAQQCIDSCCVDCDQCNKIYSMAMKMFSRGRSYERLENLDIDSEDYEAISIFRDKFIEWNNDRVMRLARKISDISLINDTYKSCDIKSARILECIDDFLYDMYKDGTHVLSKLNGELTGKTYKYNIL